MKNLYSAQRQAMLCLCVMLLSASSIFSQQIAKSLKSSTGDQVGFLEYKPPTYDKDVNTRYPVIIFFHGIGERGNGTTQLNNIAIWGPPAYIKAGYTMRFTWNGKTETFLVISPQCPTKYGMWPPAMINDFVNYAKTNLRADPNRIILTGLSMGGGGIMKYISDADPSYAENIAGAVPISMPCTFGRGAGAAAAKLPIWLFHAKDDPTASSNCSINAFNGLVSASDPIKPLLTMWPSGGHNVWSRLYGDTSYVYQDVVSIYEWMLAQNKSLPANQLPVSNAGSAITVPLGTITLNGSASTDPDGKIVRYVWKKISGPASGVITNPRSSSPTTTVTGVSIPGVYTYELAVADNRASFTRSTVLITVSNTGKPPVVEGPKPGGNGAPLANAGTDITAIAYNKVQLNASLSSDKDGWITSVKWTKVSGPDAYAITAASSSVSYATNLVNGTYVFRATVTDNKGATSYDDKKIVVTGVSGSPSGGSGTGNVKGALTVNAGADVTAKGWNQTQLNASLSSVKNGGWYTSVKWTKLSGPASYSISVPNKLITTATNLAVGVYVFRVTITDNKGSVGYDDKIVTVLSVPGGPVTNPPTTSNGVRANAGADVSAKGWNQTQLNGTLSTTLRGGWFTKYQWTKISGPAGYSITSPTAPVTYAKNMAKGVYVFRLTVTDNRGYTGYDDKKVTIVSVPAYTVTSTAAALLDSVSVFGQDLEATRPPEPVIAEGKLSVYPNPVVNTLQLQYSLPSNGKTFISVYDVSGRCVKAVTTQKSQAVLQQTLDVSDLKKGIYYIMAGTGSERVQTVKFIKQ